MRALANPNACATPTLVVEFAAGVVVAAVAATDAIGFEVSKSYASNRLNWQCKVESSSKISTKIFVQNFIFLVFLANFTQIPQDFP